MQKEGDGEADLLAGCMDRFGKEMTGTGATAQLSVHICMGEEAETGREWASVADKASGYSSRAASWRPCCSNPVWR